MSLLPKRIFFIFDFTMLIKAERAAGSTWADSAFTFGSRAIDGRDGPGPSDIAKDSSSSQEARASSSELLRVRASYISKWHRSGLESESWSLASGFVSSCSSSSSLNRNGERPSLHQSDANGTKYSLWKSSWNHSSWEWHGGKTKTCGKSSILISLAVCSCEIKDHATDILVLNTLVIETNNHSQIPPNKFVVETWYYRATVT